jgi:hypothetical protein
MIQNTNAMTVIISGENEMNEITKVLFWTLTVILGFVTPLFSVTMVVLYYLPKIIQDVTQPFNEEKTDSKMKSFSDDVMENMK